jgi:phosphate transport system protein
MSTRQPLDRELATIRRLLAEMASRVDEQFAHAMNALIQGDVDLAADVVASDDEVDALELRIDEQCERILALHAPVAADLRMIITAVKVNTDFERIGDHCRNLSRNAKYLADQPDLLTKTTIPRMADLARQMLRMAERAFLDRDRLQARKVIAQDQQVNRLHRDNFESLVQLMQEHTDSDVYAHLLTVSKALERISDHAKNIAQSVVFLVEGTDIRHRGLKQSAQVDQPPGDDAPEGGTPGGDTTDAPPEPPAGASGDGSMSGSSRAA